MSWLRCCVESRHKDSENIAKYRFHILASFTEFHRVEVGSFICRVEAIHGDMDQHSRAVALKEFSSGRRHVLVATDVAARGLDIKGIKTIINLDAAKDIDTHVHRVGRTGRAGDKEGVAYTLLTPKQPHFAGRVLFTFLQIRWLSSLVHKVLCSKRDFPICGNGGWDLDPKSLSELDCRGAFTSSSCMFKIQWSPKR